MAARAMKRQTQTPSPKTYDATQRLADRLHGPANMAYVAAWLLDQVHVNAFAGPCIAEFMVDEDRKALSPERLRDLLGILAVNALLDSLRDLQAGLEEVA